MIALLLVLLCPLIFEGLDRKQIKDCVMKLAKLIAALGIAAVCTGCATGLNSHQKSELKHFEARGQAVMEKDPGMGAALGLLPGGGSFYAREYGYGVINLLFWPLSILWDPVSGYEGSQALNYEATKAHLHRMHQRDLNELDDRLKREEITLRKC